MKTLNTSSTRKGSYGAYVCLDRSENSASVESSSLEKDQQVSTEPIEYNTTLAEYTRQREMAALKESSKGTRIRKKIVPDFQDDARRRIARSAAMGGLICGSIAILLIIVIALSDRLACPYNTCPAKWQRQFSKEGIRAYLELFVPFRPSEEEESPEATWTSIKAPRRRLADTRTPQKIRDPTLVIAGKLSIGEGACNIAQYNLKTNKWSLEERIQLERYPHRGPKVYSLVVNYTNMPLDDDGMTSKTVHRNPVEQWGSGELIVVGAFDTTSTPTSTTYCSVGKYDGLQLSEVGEGLCNSALSKGMKITTAVLAGPQDVYVAGSFRTQVWNGERHEFVKISNIAHYNTIEQVWLPLNTGQITCSWCTVTVLALVWDSRRRQLHIAGKFNAIDGRNIPAGLAVYDYDSGHLVSHPGGGLSMRNSTQDGVGTALQLDKETGVLYVMGSFERLTSTNEVCMGLAAYEIESNRWTCLADAAHAVLPTGRGNMLLTKFGLMVAGKTTTSSTWPDDDRPYAIALLKATLKARKRQTEGKSGQVNVDEQRHHMFNWTWLPGFKGHSEPLHALANGFGPYDGYVFIAGDNLVAKRSYHPKPSDHHTRSSSQPQLVPTTEIISDGHVNGSVTAISLMILEPDDTTETNFTIIMYCVSVGCAIAVFLYKWNNSLGFFPITVQDKKFKYSNFAAPTYGAIESTNIMEKSIESMRTRYSAGAGSVEYNRI